MIKYINMYNPENEYIRNIDSGGPKPPDGTLDLGKIAEDLVVNIFNLNVGGMTLRLATPSEDSGVKQIISEKQIDTVAIQDGKPIMCMQITIARDPKIHAEKINQLKNKPFVRLDEMSPKDIAIPKVVIGLDPNEIESLSNDQNYSGHPKILDKIIKDTLACLRYDLTRTEYEKEQERIRVLISFFESKKGKSLS